MDGAIAMLGHEDFDRTNTGAFFMNMRVACLIALIGAFESNACRGDYLTIPDMTIPGTADISSGLTFVVTSNLGVNDLISVRGVGTVDLENGQYTANAAGVIVSPSTTNTGNHPGQVDILNSNGFPFASILIGNADLGFHPLFPANASTGLGSSSPPTDISVLNERLGDLFGPTFSGLSSGTLLELYINDIPGEYSDNLGSIHIGSAVPEPASITLLLAGGIALLGRGFRVRFLTGPA